jgi:hypothetical protein
MSVLDWVAVGVQVWFFGSVQLVHQLWENEVRRFEESDVDPGAFL